MDRPSIERLYLAHVADLDRAIAGVTLDSGRALYREHLECTRRQLARCQGGESESNLRAAVALQLLTYQATALPGLEAEAIGWSFGELCRALGVKMASSATGQTDHREFGLFAS